MKKSILVGLIFLISSVNSYAKASGGGSFGTNDDIVAKYPSKLSTIRNLNNSIDGLKNGESIKIDAKVVVRTRNYFWLPVWKSGYANIEITKNGKPFNVNRISIQQVYKHKHYYTEMARNEGVQYQSDIHFTWYWLSFPRVEFGPNGHAINDIGYSRNVYQLPIYFNSLGKKTYKENTSSLQLALKDPIGPAIAFFNIKLSEKYGHSFSVSNEWGDYGVSIPMQTIYSY